MNLWSSHGQIIIKRFELVQTLLQFLLSLLFRQNITAVQRLQYPENCKKKDSKVSKWGLNILNIIVERYWASIFQKLTENKKLLRNCIVYLWHPYWTDVLGRMPCIVVTFLLCQAAAITTISITPTNCTSTCLRKQVRCDISLQRSCSCPVKLITKLTVF